ncbi:6-carboxytetrahydropterin synthase [Fluviicola taffensis]|uniref:6-pyruvoyl trahydropterin synthase family protein n=1 Tax=Fluviicola taffensis TaxID=191579 RepID=UPI003137AE35
MKIFRAEQFNAAHRLFNPKWDDETNDRVFGKCNNPNFHGHNYKLEVELDGPINPETGYVMDMKKLSDIIKEEILERFDHRNLNLDCPEFSDLIPSAENIALVCWNILRDQLPSDLKLKVRLWETPKNGVEYDGN